MDPTGPRHAVSTASTRLRALAGLSGSLTDALDPDQAAQLVQEEALAALGATSAVVVTLGRFPAEPGLARGAEPPADARLYLIHAIGLPGEVEAALAELPLDAPVPLADVARTGEALFLESVEEMKSYPDWGEAMVRAGALSSAIVPVWANGELRGVLGLSWASERVFDEDERAFVQTLGVMCAQAILRAYLRKSESSARELAERANLSKANFLTMISHELRTPMNAVIGYSELISEAMDGPLTGRQSEYLGKMQLSSNHLLELIEELLGYARLEAGQDLVKPEVVQLCDVVEQAVDLVRPLAERKGLRIQVERPETLELYTDMRKLRQVLINLLANAIKFTETGAVTLLVHVDGEDSRIRIIFEVTDTGSGMSPDAQTHLFDAFWQQNPGVRKGGGTGLGLPIARQLARLLGGDVKLQSSTEGQGSTFIVYLPVRYSPSSQTPSISGSPART